MAYETTLSKQIEVLSLNTNIKKILNIPDFELLNLMSSRNLVFVKNRKRGYYIRCLKMYNTILNHVPSGIIMIEISSIDFNLHELKYLPDTLKCLKINNTKRGIEKMMKNIILPKRLIQLDLSRNRIYNLNGIKLPNRLKRLDLSSNNIDNEGIKNFIFPIYLEKLILMNNRIFDHEGLLLPPRLKHINLSINRIINNNKFIFPPSIEEIIFNYTKYSTKYNMNRIDLVEKAKSKKGIKMYNPILNLYTYRKKILFTICKGLIYGETSDPIFIFFKKIYGSKNIRKNILESYI